MLSSEEGETFGRTIQLDEFLCYCGIYRVGVAELQLLMAACL